MQPADLDWLVTEMKSFIIDGKALTTEDAFHDHFASTFGFPHYYGRNMNAWNDWMSDQCLAHCLILIHIENVRIFRKQMPQLFSALVDSSAFLNWRATSEGGDPLIALSYFN